MNSNWTIYDLRREFNSIINRCEKIYNRKFDRDLEMRINGRLSRALGRFRYYRDGEPIAIEISKKVVESKNDTLVRDILGHEVAHYIMHQLGYINEGHGCRFSNLCDQLGVSNGVSIENEIADAYKEVVLNLNKQREEEEKRKKENARYIVICDIDGCSTQADYYKVARKESMYRWLGRYVCPAHGRTLVCYDKKEKQKYYLEGRSIKHKNMTEEEIKKFINDSNYQ